MTGPAICPYCGHPMIADMDDWRYLVCMACDYKQSTIPTGSVSARPTAGAKRSSCSPPHRPAK